MRWTMRERWVLVKSLAARYQKSGKKEKSQLLEEFIEMTGYNRVYGAYLLGQEGREIRLSPKWRWPMCAPGGHARERHWCMNRRKRAR